MSQEAHSEESQQQLIQADKEAKARLIISMDGVPSLDHLVSLVKQLRDLVGCFSVGSALCTAAGAPKAIEAIKENGGKAFLDLKFHDDPETVGKAVSQAASWGVDMISVHGAGGLEMLQFAAQNRGKSKILAVMPSLSFQESTQVYGKYAEAVALNLTHLARNARCDGIICLPEVLPRVSHHPLLKAVTGIDQGLACDGGGVNTPLGAIKAGANLLVINQTHFSPHVSSGGPRERIQSIRREITGHLLQQRK